MSPAASYRFLDHTADVGADLSAPDLGSLFAAALAAFTDTLTERERVEPRDERRISLAAPGLEELLVAWLEELLYLFETEEALFRDAEVSVEERGGGWGLDAVARGERHDPERHPAKVLVKGITYHGLAVRPDADRGWTGRVIFDV